MKRLLKILWAAPLLVACQGASIGGDGIEELRNDTPLVETGELSAVQTKAFVLPRLGWFGSFRIIGIEEHGKHIQPGDSVIQLDPADVTKHIVDRETALESQLASLEKMLVNQENRDSEAESTIKSELATYELRKLTLEAAQFESERTRKIKEPSYLQKTPIDFLFPISCIPNPTQAASAGAERWPCVAYVFTIPSTYCLTFTATDPKQSACLLAISPTNPLLPIITPFTNRPSLTANPPSPSTAPSRDRPFLARASPFVAAPGALHS